MAHALTGDRPHHHARARSRAAAVSIVSNTLLIALKVVAGILTGSVAILTEALHSGIDLLASLHRLLLRPPRRGAGRRRPPLRPREVRERRRGRRGHADPGRLRGDRVRRDPLADQRPRARAPRRRHRRDRLRQRRQPRGLAAGCSGARARPSSAALEGDAAHLRTDAYTSIGVLVGLALVSVTGAEWLDPVVALIIAARDRRHRRSGSRWARCACSSTRRSPTTSSTRSASQIESFAGRGVVGYHQLRTRRAGARRYVDLHVQFRHGTTLEEAHRTAHELQDAIRASLGGADVLIHLEPEDRVRPGEVLRTG